MFHHCTIGCTMGPLFLDVLASAAMDNCDLEGYTPLELATPPTDKFTGHPSPRPRFRFLHSPPPQTTPTLSSAWVIVLKWIFRVQLSN